MANYNYLVNDVLAATENSSTEFLNYIPYMVNRAEERLTKDLDDYGLVSYTSVAVSANEAILTLPTGTLIVKNFNIVNNGSKVNILLRTDEYINDYWPVESSVGDPRYYAKRNNSTILIAPTPASTYDGVVVHVSRPVTLTSATPNNYFSDYCYDLLFAATMIEAMMYQKDNNGVNSFTQRYMALLDLQRNQARRTRRDDLQTPASPAGGDNTVVPNAN